MIRQMYQARRISRSEFVPIRGLNYHLLHWGPAPADANSALPPLVLLATLLVTSLLLFARVGQTEVELEAVVDGVQFTLAAHQPLTETLVLQSLGPRQASLGASVDGPTTVRLEMPPKG